MQTEKVTTREISIRELREWYETKPLKEVMDHFSIPSVSSLYKLLDRAMIPRKAPQNTIVLVD